MDVLGVDSTQDASQHRRYKNDAGEAIQLKWGDHQNHQKQSPTFRVQASDSVGPTTVSTSMLTIDGSGEMKGTHLHTQSAGSGTVSGRSAQEKSQTAAKWTLADDQCMLDVLLFARESGDVATSGHFKIQTWHDVTFAVAASTTSGGRKDVDICKSRLQRVELAICSELLTQLRKDYRNIKFIKDQPGFQWNSEQCMLVASDEAWDSYIKMHPEQHKYRTLKFPQFDAIATLGDDELPEGHTPVKAIQPRPFINRTIQEESTPSHTPPLPSSSHTPQPPLNIPPLPQGQTATFAVPYSQRPLPGPSGQTYTSCIQPQVQIPTSQQSTTAIKRPVPTPTPDDNKSEAEEVEEHGYPSGTRNGTPSTYRPPSRSRKKPRLDTSFESTPTSSSMGPPPPPPKSPPRGASLPDLSVALGDSLRCLKGPLDDYVELQRGYKLHPNQLPPNYPEPLHLPSRHRVNTAVMLLLDQEPHLSPNEKARLVDTFGRDNDSADRYILFSYKPEAAAVRAAWIQLLLS